MKLFIILFLLFSFNQKTFAGQNQDLKKFYDERAEFIKKYISFIKEKKKEDKEFKGSVVESVNGQMFIRYGVSAQKQIDNQALKDCRDKGGLECLVRFRTLKKNEKYNRLAEYINSKKRLKVLGEYMNSKKVNSIRGIDILINIEDFKNKTGFGCTKTKSKFQDVIKIFRKEIELYPYSFLKNSGLKYVVICEKINDDNIDFEPAGIAPGHYDKSPGVFYLNLSVVKNRKDKENLIKEIFHHEFYHVIDAHLSLMQLDEKWNKIHNQEYLGNFTAGAGIDNSIKGYISEYGRSNAAEDKAEVFKFMIINHKEFKETIAKDDILFKKSQLMISRLKSLSRDINKKFWKKLN